LTQAARYTRWRAAWARLLASPIDFSVLLSGLADVPPIFEGVLFASRAEVPPSAPPSGKAAPAVRDLGAVRQQVQEVVQGMLGADVRPDQPLMEAGMDSLAAVDLQNELGRRFGLIAPATLMFDYPTVEALADFVASNGAPAVPELDVAPTWSVAEVQGASGVPVAAFGFSCLYATGIADVEGFRLSAAGGADLQRPVPWSRWDVDRFYSPEIGASDAVYARFGTFIDGVELFDAPAFGLTRVEATSMDPQHRLLLCETHAALEDSGISGGSPQRAATGVYVCVRKMEDAVLPARLLPTCRLV